MQMAVYTARDAVCLEQIQNFSAAELRVDRRIVQKADNLRDILLFCRLERGLQPDQLTAEDLLVVALLEILFEKPAARAADAGVAVHKAVVEQKLDAVNLMRLEELRHFAHRRPPQIVVSLEDDLLSRQTFDHLKIRQCLLQIDAPRDIAADDNRVVIRDQMRPVLPDLLL